ncbi:MAG: hypothetical protein IPK82_22150 [Polyangiaceae bacterium]|nr:hypothetical protein [Polyangiaceae bacterium]
MNAKNVFRPVIPLALFAASALLATPASAVGTRTFQIDSLDDFKGGDFTGASVDSNGNLRAGLALGATPLKDAQGVWSSVTLSDGSVLLGTGNDGKIFKVSGGQVSLAATTGQMAASAMVTAWGGDVIVGTFPEGKMFKLPGGKGDGKDAAKFADLPDTEDVWALAFDEKAKALYAATGPEGKVYRIDQSGKAQVYFDSDEPHIVSLALDSSGAVYAGSNGKGLLYKITAPGRASVVHDFDADDVKAIAVAADGSVYAIANKYNEAFSPPKRNRTNATGPTGSKPGRPGKGELTRFGKTGVAEKMLEDKDTHYVTLTLGDDGQAYVGTGAEGRVYTVDDNHLSRLVADTEERQVGALVMSGKKKFVATTDPVVFHEVKGDAGADAVWTSKVLDAGLRATFGRLTWRSDGQVELETRSGATETPDNTWSAWSKALTAPGDVQSPAGRYVQMRVRFGKDAKASLREIALSFVTDNARALVTSIDAVTKNQPRGSIKTGIVQSGSETLKAQPSVKISWRTDNPDQDELRYRLYYRVDGQSTWRSLLKPAEKLTRADYDWDVSALPEGTYRIKVEATDELANPPDKVTSHTLESATVVVDTTAPVFKALSITGRQLKGEIVDGIGPVARIEVSIAGSDEWRPLAPSDGVFDEAAETFDSNIAALVPAGSHILAVRAFDIAGNVVMRDVEAK